MNKLLIALIASTFALGSVAALAQDKTPAEPVDEAKMKAEREAHKKAKSSMTKEQKKAAQAKKQKETSKLVEEGNPAPGTADAAAMKKNYEATKNDPKALPTNEAKQKAITEQSKKGGQ